MNEDKISLRWTLLLGLDGSFGVGEMRTDTAARLIGYDSKNLSSTQRAEIVARLCIEGVCR